MTDEEFFTIFPDRDYHIRKPGKEKVINKQRAVHIEDECRREFEALGGHDKDRRMIILYRIPKDSPWYDPRKGKILKVPFLMFSDESIEDDDQTLGPIFHEIMVDARERYGNG